MNTLIENQNLCLACAMELEDDLVSQYRFSEDQEWINSRYCWDCIQYMIENNWSIYLNGIAKADCAAALNRLIVHGPPINIRDPVGFIDPNNCKAIKDPKGIILNYQNNDVTLEVKEFLHDNIIISAKLKDSYQGEQRLTWWDELKAIKAGMEASESKEKS